MTVAANGSYTFNPNAAANALANGVSVVETITYTVSDGEGGTDTATLTLTITGGNDAPSSTALPNQNHADANAVSLDVSGNFTDPDAGDTLTYTATGLPTGLTIDLNMDEAQGGVSSRVAEIAEILLLPPDAAELAAHDTVLKSLDKEVKGQCIWRQLPLN